MFCLIILLILFGIHLELVSGEPRNIYVSLYSTFCWVTDGTVYCCIYYLHMVCPDSVTLIISYYVNRIICVVRVYSYRSEEVKFTTLKQQNAHYCSLDIHITISHRIILHVSIHKGSSSENQIKTIPHKTKLVTFIHSWLFCTMWIRCRSGCLFLCGTAKVWFPDDDPLWIETYRIIQCDILRKSVVFLVGWMLWIGYRQCLCCTI